MPVPSHDSDSCGAPPPRRRSENPGVGVSCEKANKASAPRVQNKTYKLFSERNARGIARAHSAAPADEGVVHPECGVVLLEDLSEVVPEHRRKGGDSPTRGCSRDSILLSASSKTGKIAEWTKKTGRLESPCQTRWLSKPLAFVENNVGETWSLAETYLYGWVSAVRRQSWSLPALDHEKLTYPMGVPKELTGDSIFVPLKHLIEVVRLAGDTGRTDSVCRPGTSSGNACNKKAQN
ncbi:hypothetical protein C8R47DRAFT_1062554 [Mycena vitilis]|nr:hypothetical protein C8R47DRAFT_1062554 [Mycena vitilis]